MKDEQIFTPTGRDMRIEYPELLDMEEFNSMPNNDIKFCWLYACRSSPYLSMPEEVKIDMCLKTAYGNNFFEDRTAMLIKKGDIPEAIAMGINKMKTFIPSVRHDANKIMMEMFGNLKKMIKIDDDEFIAMEMDEKKQYVSMCKDVSATLPTIVQQLEIGFSVKKKTIGSKDNTDEDDDLMDAVIDEEES